jgi:hypothetical protein
METVDKSWRVQRADYAGEKSPKPDETATSKEVQEIVVGPARRIYWVELFGVKGSDKKEAGACSNNNVACLW